MTPPAARPPPTSTPPATKADALRAVRSAMVLQAALWLPQRGMAAVNLIEVARAVQAPRGSIYHYFPGGRDQLLHEALSLAGQSGLRMIDKAARQSTTPQALVQALFNAAHRQTTTPQWASGCPVGAALLSSDTENDTFAQLLPTILASWHTALTTAFVALGCPSDAQASHWARCTLIAYEGALVCAKGMATPAEAASVLTSAAQMVQALLAAAAASTDQP